MRNLGFTAAVIALNCAIYFLEYFVYNPYEFSIFFGLNELFFAGAYWQILTSMFIHGSLMHILMNMIVLYQFGMILERYLRWIKFGILYIFGGVITGFLSLGYLAFESVNLVGASGAISVLLGFLACIDKFNRKGLIVVILLVSFAPLLMGISVAWYAHLIGFGVGYLAGFLKVFR
ncbi:rhomboid family intramembrane serine protease [Campylobacter lanienae]|uniref:rhomboid family intramembrane serine protease n=1 Tax=Campylobacter lanienae TaxID=75658 RepID=UPI00242AABB0|nr:rhomboid family intramembrane serine protease [Campylobacter lanienae]MDD5786712.1 rhomboid family intramembrane serine protease [Campylobacter lanienae]